MSTLTTPAVETKANTLTADEIKAAVRDGMKEAITLLTAAPAGGDGASTGQKGNGPTPADLLLAAGGSKNVNVKGAGDRYSKESTVLKHVRTGQTVRDAFGNEPKSISELNHAKAGAFFRMLGAKAGMPVEISEHDKSLMDLCYGEKWCGHVGNDYHPELDGGRVKTLLNDSVSGGTNAVPYFFDTDLITYPLLFGELYPMVDVRNVPRGNSVHGASMATPGVTWNVSEGTDMPLFDTGSLIAAFNTTIFNVTAALEVGRDFLQDSPMEIGRSLTEQIGQKLASELDRVVACGNGTSEPQGISNASGTTTVHSTNSTSGPAVVADYSG